MVVLSKEYGLNLPAGKTHRSHLRTGLSCVTGRTEALAIQADPVGVAGLGTPFDCAGPPEGERTSQSAVVAGNGDVLPWEHAEGVLVPDFDGEGFSGRTAESGVASERVLAFGRALSD